jgi:anaerobic selenocysteine-containing dehydrogenase
MGLTRREFLQAAGATTVGAVVFTGCRPPERELQAQSRVRLAEDVLSAYETWYARTCRQCGAGCGVIVRVIEGRSRKVEGTPDHPINRGKLGARGQAMVQEQYHPDRWQGPYSRNRATGALTAITWERGLNQLVGRLREIQQQGRAGDVVLVTPPLRGHQALVLGRFARAYGAPWMVFDPLGEAPLSEAVRRVFGQEVLPEFDIQRARYVLSFGADFLSGWLSPVHYSGQYGVFREGSYRAGQFEPRQSRPRGHLVQVEPRFSLTAANADDWIPARPGTEGLLALAIAQVILSENLADADGARAFDRSALNAYQPGPELERETGIPAERIRQIARDFATRRPSVAMAGGAAGAYTNGTDALSAALALNVLVGNVGRSGGVRFNPAPPIEGLASPRPSPLRDWQDLAERLRDGRVQAMLVYGANPAYGLPSALGFREALTRAPFIASFSSVPDETSDSADLILPSHLPLEDWGDDAPEPGPGFQVITLQQPVVPPLYDTRSVWDVLLTAGADLGGSVRQALPWATFKEVLREGARALQRERRGSVQEGNFERFWLQMLQRGGWWDEGGTQAITPVGAQGVGARFQRAEFAGSAQEFPYHLVVFAHNTLGAGEAAHLPWLQGAPDPITTVTWQTWIEINPKEAQRLGLREGDIVIVEAPEGRKIEAPVYPHPAAAPGIVAMPLGQGHTSYGRWAKDRGANPLSILAPLADAASGALAYEGTRVRLINTGRRANLPKFEGTVPAFQIPGQEVVQVTPNA